jgi:hypothetical protein
VVRLYEAFAFQKAETTYQYVISSSRLQEFTAQLPQTLIEALTIDKVAQDAMPPLPEE